MVLKYFSLKAQRLGGLPWKIGEDGKVRAWFRGAINFEKRLLTKLRNVLQSIKSVFPEGDAAKNSGTERGRMPSFFVR